MDRLLVVRLSEALPLKEKLLSVVAEPRKEKAMRYVKEADQVRSLVGSCLIERYVGVGRIVLQPHGKPFMPGGPEFSLSHAGDFIGIYISDDVVGLDIESISRCELSLIPAAFTQEEANTITDQATFAFAWTRKEAVTKCLGRGIESPAKNGLSLIRDGIYAYQAQEYAVKSFLFEDHAFALARSEERRVGKEC